MRTETRGTSVTTPAQAVDSAPAGDQCSPPRGKPDRSTFPQHYWFRVLCFSLVAMTGLISDLWSKHTVFSWLKFPGQHQVWKGSFLGIPVDFQFATTFNLGALWGMGHNGTGSDGTEGSTLDKIYHEVKNALDMIEELSKTCPAKIEDLGAFFDCIGL